MTEPEGKWQVSLEAKLSPPPTDELLSTLSEALVLYSGAVARVGRKRLGVAMTVDGRSTPSEASLHAVGLLERMLRVEGFEAVNGIDTETVPWTEAKQRASGLADESNRAKWEQVRDNAAQKVNFGRPRHVVETWRGEGGIAMGIFTDERVRITGEVPNLSDAEKLSRAVISTALEVGVDSFDLVFRTVEPPAGVRRVVGYEALARARDQADREALIEMVGGLVAVGALLVGAAALIRKARR